jgi:hypothetical protein
MNITQLIIIGWVGEKKTPIKNICLPPMIPKKYMEWAPLAKEKLMFEVTRIWPVNPKAMDGKNGPN